MSIASGNFTVLCNSSRYNVTGPAVLSYPDAPDPWGISLDGARWIWSEYPIPEDHQLHGDSVDFRSEFAIPGNNTIIERATIWITVDDGFALLVNDRTVGQRASTDVAPNLRWKTILSFDCTGCLIPGNNSILVKAENKGWEQMPNPAGVLFRLDASFRESDTSDQGSDGNGTGAWCPEEVGNAAGCCGMSGLLLAISVTVLLVTWGGNRNRRTGTREDRNSTLPF
jgi:hypothetical protein